MTTKRLKEDKNWTAIKEKKGIELIMFFRKKDKEDFSCDKRKNFQDDLKKYIDFYKEDFSCNKRKNFQDDLKKYIDFLEENGFSYKIVFKRIAISGKENAIYVYNDYDYVNNTFYWDDEKDLDFLINNYKENFVKTEYLYYVLTKLRENFNKPENDKQRK